MTTSRPALTDPWELAGLRVPNRVLLAPLAGIGNWFVRLQAARHGAGMAYSEMVSSFAIHYGNEKTLTELLRVHPDEGPTALQLFGQDPEIMRSAAAYVAEHVPQVDVIDLNMGCPVPKVCKTGAGAAMLKDPDTAVAVARAAHEGSGKPVTVKLRSGSVPGDTTSGIHLAHRLVEEAGVAAITFHPRSAKVHHKGTPDYDLAARLVESLPAPVILSGGLHTVEEVKAAYERTGAAAVMLARGSLGNPWLFEQLLGRREEGPSPAEILAEWQWVMDRAEEHLGAERAGRYLRKFHPWYVERLGGSKELHTALQQTATVDDARAVLDGLGAAVPAV
ncbi:MAG TPA: tRNA-dihydrouridine synthase family protein [Baekduia sp.]|uniref:tRNA dihydrouridine synthase n=1 Tax=Baekduia sp. TaxID=2600305 RepID=UPI002D77FC66|nr:tRNA-dihydrouridine synthase family protein [Baekduia sp.]HET6508276.1 tRNA-dihydrouridine synthase family protein [Baekduia sp.]